MSSFWHYIYTFFTHIYTLLFGSPFTRKPRKEATLTPYPLDLECGSNVNNDTASVLKNEPLIASPSPTTLSPPPSPHDHTFALNTFRFNPAKISPGVPSPLPTTPSLAISEASSPSVYTQDAMSQYALGEQTRPSTVSVLTSPSVYSTPPTPKTNRSSTYSVGSSIGTTPSSSRSRNRHRKQSPLIWDKDMSTIAIAASVSMSSVSSRGSSLGPSLSAGASSRSQHHHAYYRHQYRQRTTPISPLSHIKHDPSMSYKRNAARISTNTKKHLQNKIQIYESSPREDPVSVVRKVFGEVRMYEEKRGGAASIRARLKRDTVKSFGGMDVLTEEDEGEGDEQMLTSPCLSKARAVSVQESRPSSVCSTPSTLGPVTPKTPHTHSVPQPQPHSHLRTRPRPRPLTGLYAALADPGFITDVDAEADDEYGGFDTDGYGFETDPGYGVGGFETDGAIESEPSMYSVVTVGTGMGKGRGLPPSATSTTLHSMRLAYLEEDPCSEVEVSSMGASLGASAATSTTSTMDRATATSTPPSAGHRLDTSVSSTWSLSSAALVPISSPLSSSLSANTNSNAVVGPGAKRIYDSHLKSKSRIPVSSLRQEQQQPYRQQHHQQQRPQQHQYNPSPSSSSSVMDVSERDVERTVLVMKPMSVMDESCEVCISGEEEEEVEKESEAPGEERDSVDAAPGQLEGLDEQLKSLDEQLRGLDEQLRGLDEQLRVGLEVESVELDVGFENARDSLWIGVGSGGSAKEKEKGKVNVKVERRSVVSGLGGDGLKKMEEIKEDKENVVTGGGGVVPRFSKPVTVHGTGHRRAQGHGLSVIKYRELSGVGYGSDSGGDRASGYHKYLTTKALSRDTLVMRDSAHWSDIIQLH